MRASKLVRAGSLATAAVIAGGGAMVTAGAANAATAWPAKRLPTHLVIEKVGVVPHHKKLVVIAGDLRSHNVPLRGKVVYLDRKTAGHKWTVVAKEVTRKHGDVGFVVSPKVPAKFALVFKGSANFQPTHSRVVSVKAQH
jgi:hypothetical protein